MTIGQNTPLGTQQTKAIKPITVNLEQNFKADVKKHVPPTNIELTVLSDCFSQGQFVRAKQLAIGLTKKSPKHPTAWKLLGVIYQQDEDLEHAEFALKKATELAPKDPEAHYNLGNYYFDQQWLNQAETSYRKAVNLAPQFAVAHFNLAKVQKELTKYKEAEASYKKGIKIAPDYAQVYSDLAEVLAKQTRFKEAITAYKKSIQLSPNEEECHIKLGMAFLATANFDDAETALNKALLLNPKCTSARNALGLVYQERGQSQKAIEYFKEAIDINPDYPAPYKNMGLAYQALGELNQAETCYLKAISFKNINAETYNNLTVIYLNQGRLNEAETHVKKALELAPKLADAWNNLGLILQAQCHYEEAEKAFEKALAINPNDARTLVNFNITLKTLGKLTQAVACLKKAIKLEPNNPDAYINLSNTYYDQSLIEQGVTQAQKAISLDPNNQLAYNNCLFGMQYANVFDNETRKTIANDFGMLVERLATPFKKWEVSTNPKVLRIGFVSGDFRMHPVAYFLKNTLAHLPALQFELFAYSTTGATDAATQALKPHFSQWSNIAGLNDAKAAAHIHQDNLHILVDLSGHTAGNRLGVFAFKPAPVQVTWLGYWATTGVKAIDFVIADNVSIPNEHQTQFSEQVAYIPTTRMCFTPPETTLTISPLPALKNNVITFGSFQNLAKVSDEVLNLWAKVLHAIPHSQLRWQTKAFADADMQQATLKRLADCGVQAHQVKLLGKVAHQAYLQAHAEVDVILDSFPFTGGTTTCDALWMGVPTLTLAGNNLIARQGASFMQAAGLPDWVVDSQESFVQQAIALTQNVDALARLRAGLRNQMVDTPLFNGAIFAKNLSAVFFELWNKQEPKLLKTNAINNASKNTIKPNHKHANSAIQCVITLVSATRLSEQEFWQSAALGLSFKQHSQQDERLKLQVAFNNTQGLSTVFNQVIDQADDDAVLVFIHDDVWLDQAKFGDAVLEGLTAFDVIGVAGNTRRLPQQPAWLYKDIQFTWDTDFLSGKVAHGERAFGTISEFGPLPASCELMDGVFLATKKSTLVKHQVRFDEQFKFHFYDLDFCRTARQANLTLGTWPIALTHQSGGAFGSEHWRQNLTLYLNKWEPETENQSAQITQLFQQALALQEAGEIENAVNGYLKLLEIEPTHAGANHQLGFIEAHTVSLDAALARFEIAVTTKPQVEQYWVSYIDALVQYGAVDVAKKAIAHGQQFGLSVENATVLLSEIQNLRFDVSESTARITQAEEVDVIEWKSPTKQKNKHEISEQAFPQEWLRAYPTSLMIEYTSRCNLRCKYCPKSNPGEDAVAGRNMDMTHNTVDAVIALILQHPYQELLLAGTGESTFHPHWLEDFPRLISAGKQANASAYIHLNSNFATKFEDEHWAVLAQLDGIVISIDTADRQLTKEVRAKSDLGLIIYNIVRFQTYCEARNLSLPQLTVNVTLYQKAAAGLEELMIMLSKLPIAMVAISDMYEGKAATINGIQSINAADPHVFNSVVVALEKAINRAHKLGKFKLSVQPHLLERIQLLQSQINGVNVIAQTSQTLQGQQLTKLCLQPWTRFTLAADAAVFPCCVTDMESVGRIDTQLPEDGLDGHKIQLFRKRLLSGDVPSICVECTNAPTCTTQQLQQSVNQLANTHKPLSVQTQQLVTNKKVETSALNNAVEEVLELATTAFNNGQFNDAIALAKETLGVNPTHGLANFLVGVCLANLASQTTDNNQPLNTTAIDMRYFEAALQAEPENAQYWVSYVDALVVTNQLTHALNVIELAQQSGISEPTLAQQKQEIIAQQTTTLSPEARLADLCSAASMATCMRQCLTVNIDAIKQSLAENSAKPINADLDLTAFKPILDALTEAGNINGILELTHKVILNIKLIPEFVGHKIFTPYFDDVLSNIQLACEPTVERTHKTSNIIMATELYDFGGHTKVVGEIIASVDNPLLVITDIYNRFTASPVYAKLATLYGNCPVLVLPNEPYANKAQRLANLINQSANTVFIVAHHDDSVAMAACQTQLDTQYYFVHHADHNPALGNHIKHLKHVDLFSERAHNCQQDLHVKTFFMPTTAEDMGVKEFDAPINTYSTVTAGSFGKFLTQGPLSLSAIVVTALTSTGGLHYHFGEIPTENLSALLAELQAAGCDSSRFNYMGNVASLWQSLKAIDAHIYIGSAPLMGAKSDIEAQGAGYPLVAYKASNSPRHLNVGGHNNQTQYWHDVIGLKAGLSFAMQHHAQLSMAARNFYQSECTVEKRNKVLSDMTQ
jgi:protein O-GlcNAc transferase